MSEQENYRMNKSTEFPGIIIEDQLTWMKDLQELHKNCQKYFKLEEEFQ